MARRLAAIMFTDVAGFTASAQADEAVALSRLREQEGIVRPLFPPFGGHEIKSTGDGFLVEFESALKATECAVEIQRRLHERNAREPEAPIRLRIGIHVGDVEEGGGDIFGDAVNVASRVVPLADPGGVCLSDHVFAHVRNKVPYRLEKLSRPNLKGVSEGFDVYRVVLPWSQTVGPAVAGPPFPRIAILPLANISPDPQNEYFADGLTEELITVLSQIRGLRVISRTSVNQYKGTTKPVAQIGSELGADSVLEGSVRKVGDQLRIAVQLIDTRTDDHRWAQTYDRKLENVFAIQADVAERTASALKVELLKSEQEAIQEKPTSNLRAYELYLRAVQASREPENVFGEGVGGEATKLFEEAVRSDPQFSAAHAALANHLLALLGTSQPAKDVIPRVREAVARALELNPNSSAAHTARGNLAFQGDLDWTRAEAEFQQGIALNPSSSEARFWYAYLLGALQRFNESIRQYHAAIELDPLWLVPRSNLAVTYAYSGDIDAAIASAEQLVRSFDETIMTRMILAWFYAIAGRDEDAVAMLGPKAKPSLEPAGRFRAVMLGYLGRTEELRAVITDLEAGRGTGYMPAVDRAALYAILGDKEKALGLLETEYREGDRTLWNAYQNPAWDALRGDPRFVALLRAMNLPCTLKRPLFVPRNRPPTAAG
jgi:adenylate cyclase